MKSEKNITIIAISSIIAAYGVVKTVKLKTTEPNMSQGDRTLAGLAILGGLFGLGVGLIGFNKA